MQAIERSLPSYVLWLWPVENDVQLPQDVGFRRLGPFGHHPPAEARLDLD